MVLEGEPCWCGGGGGGPCPFGGGGGGPCPCGGGGGGGPCGFGGGPCGFGGAGGAAGAAATGSAVTTFDINPKYTTNSLKNFNIKLPARTKRHKI